MNRRIAQMTNSINFSDLAKHFADEGAARELLETIRWPDGSVCPHCGVIGGAYKLTPKPDSKRPVREGVYKCKDCRKQFTITVGTIFEGSRIPLHKWLMAIYLMCSSKKGISAHQLHRTLDITYKSAWFMAHRVREAMRDNMINKLKQRVEVDETFIGGKTKRWIGKPKHNKTAVMVLVERGREGRARSIAVADTTASTLQHVVETNVRATASLNTDEYISYQGLNEYLKGGHKTANHSNNEYVRYERIGKRGRATKVTTNTAESFFALFKRGIRGTFHHISKKHMQRYAGEFAFRWSFRNIPDADRAVKIILGAEGRRFTYRRPSKASA